MIKKSLIFLLSLLCASLAFDVSCAFSAPLPDVLDEWQATPTQTVDLTTETENHGRWQNRVYTRRAPIADVEVNLTEGPGTGTLRVPEGDVAVDDSPIGFSSTYRTLNLSGRRAILEHGKITGQVLAVALGDKQVLTIESKSLSEEELLDFAQRLIVALQAKDF